MFCDNCGNKLTGNEKFCTVCGNKLIQDDMTKNRGQFSYGFAMNRDDLVHKYSERVMTNAIIWIVIAGIQLLAGVLFYWICLIPGVINLVAGITDFKYSKTIVQNPVGIVDKAKPLTMPIITLIYNLLIGGVIGVIGSIYYFIAIRGFVMENEGAFLDIESSYQ